ncbi:hypothetical protein DFH28DRAFT_196073 [Melampsora americana]|nr:hypothetical protein DFH28DRAFT_196073 [Melampsora americana]
MKGNLWLIKSFLIFVIKVLPYHTSLELELKSELSGEKNLKGNCPLGIEFDSTKDSMSTGIFKQDLKNSARTEEEQLNQLSHQMYNNHERTDHEHLKPKSLPTHSTYSDSLIREMDHLTYENLYSTNHHPQDMNHLQPSSFEDIWEDTYWIPPHMLTSTEPSDTFDPSVYINEYPYDSNNLHTYEDFLKNHYPGQNTFGSQESLNPNLERMVTLQGENHCSTSATQYPNITPPSSIGKMALNLEKDCTQEGLEETGILETIDDAGHVVPDEMNPFNYGVSEKIQMMDKSMGLQQGINQFQHTSVLGPNIYSTKISESGKRNLQSIQTVNPNKENSLFMLEGTRGLNNNNADKTIPGSANHELLVMKRKSHHIENLVPDSVDISAPKKQKSIPEGCVSKTKAGLQSIHYFLVLQEIGMKNSNRSSKLCYEIYDFFWKTYEKIKSQNKLNLKEIEDVKNAVRNAGHKVSMTFLGILRVFEGEGYDSDGIEDLLNDGWDFIKEFYSSWQRSKYDDLGFEHPERYSTQDVFDPDFHLRYLKKIHVNGRIPLSFVHSISLLWSKERGRSKIPQDLSKDWQKINDVSKLESEVIQGGLYERFGIRNHSFWGAGQLIRRKWKSDGDTMRSSQLIWKLASNAAQFHTNVGQRSCKELHTFFEDLIQKLQSSYKNLNGHDTLQDISAESEGISSETHSKNLELIIKAVSMAEYRVIVPFMGLIRILNEKDLSVEELQELMDNAIDFVKEEFKKWETLDFHPQNLLNLFEYKMFTVKSQSKLGDPVQMFKILFGYSDTNGFPNQAILFLLRSWYTSVLTSKPGSKDHLQFRIEEIPLWKFEKWNSYVKKMLTDEDSIESQKWKRYMSQG